MVSAYLCYLSFERVCDRCSNACLTGPPGRFAIFCDVRFLRVMSVCSLSALLVVRSDSAILALVKWQSGVILTFWVGLCISTPAPSFPLSIIAVSLGLAFGIGRVACICLHSNC